MSIDVIVGGQYGSEGKGALAGALAGRWMTHVRAGAANAGHTLYVAGERHVVQQLPCAAYAHPDAALALAPGALISADILAREISDNVRWRAAHGHPPLELLVDHRAHIITAEHVWREQASTLAARIGSTSATAGEGIGEAQAARVLRDESARVAAEHPELLPDGCQIGDVPVWLRARQDDGVLLEGTQGTGLSNITGQFPYVTSRDVSAAGLAADCGVGPRLLSDILMVVRPYPIRVAGPSGPFWAGSVELTWTQVGQPAERTTVTGLERRVASFSVEQVEYAAHLNSATHLALTFCDYLEPTIRDLGAVIGPERCIVDPQLLADRYPKASELVALMERRTGLPVCYLGCGPDAVLAYASDAESPAEAERRLATWRELVGRRMSAGAALSAR